ncbi:LOW QUALITY PROTEIN: hypothetical protein HID58_079825 [Brassica napus]|uniref:Zinc knuckle CX2CX4HX4C domain-containing protein n=1 Tax=Brassica napus TaxID=3708 RepID=A0ABQ7Y334_BRANA|nr:LOW QUALITY PROTEIN: hypothetical protein HID58_079825 [Brassica napus]
MLIQFSRKGESPEGDEVTLEIKYEMLFKHCSTCGMLTHEKEYCPSLDVKNRIQPQTERHGVFTRVQVPLDQRHNQSISHQNNGTQPRYGNEISHGRYNQSCGSRYDSSDRKYDEESNYRRSHSDRIMRRRDDHSRSNRYGGSRAGTGPYDRKPALTWRQKSLGDQREYCVEPPITSQDIVPYEHSAGSEAMRSPEAPVTRGLASTIVTPSRVDIPIEENVTKHLKEATRALSFPALIDQELQEGLGDKQIIGALSDMEIADPHDGEMMECDVRDDDLLGQELTEMDSLGSRQASVKIGRSDDKPSRSRRNGAKTNVSLGITRNLRFFVGDLLGSV